MFKLRGSLYNLGMKISTKTGDDGESRLYSGKRLKKFEPVFMVLGEIDELNSVLGVCKARLRGTGESAGVAGGAKMPEAVEAELLSAIQGDLYRIMAILGNEGTAPKGLEDFSEKDVSNLEFYIEKYEMTLGQPLDFVAPGKTLAGANLDAARSVCRRMERIMFAYNESSRVPEAILKYANRLSDLLFLMARSLENKKKQ